ncbi:protein C19orf12 homolog [Melanaphis sacchari]|uniref:protein C19orf12 homolog n=1 Tax=Melanaphis sacchari TaxID=742174 RepID=UPI000DC1392D|nr:protein C19orf12 homolog [Melanaphis sacchari]
MSSVTPKNVIKSLEVVGEIFQEENLKITVKESVKGGLITGIAALVGGLLGGKSGLIAGGVMGTVAACSMTNDFKSFLQIIHEMDYEKQKKLFDTIQNVVSSIDISDAVKLMLLLTTSQSIKQAVIHETINFLRNEMSLEICRS